MFTPPTFRVFATFAIATSLVVTLPVQTFANNTLVERLRLKIERPLHPVEVKRESHPSRRDVWKRKLQLFDRPTTGAVIEPKAVQPIGQKVHTGTIIDFWDLSSTQRLELRAMLRRGGCPQDLHISIRTICLDLLKRAPKPTERPQQFNRGEGR